MISDSEINHRLTDILHGYSESDLLLFRKMLKMGKLCIVRPLPFGLGQQAWFVDEKISEVFVDSTAKT